MAPAVQIQAAVPGLAGTGCSNINMQDIRNVLKCAESSAAGKS